MAFDYAEIRAEADELITEFGGTMTLRQITDGGDPWNPTPVEADHSVTGVVVDYENNEIDGTVIQAGDRRALLKAGGLAATPDTGNFLICGSETWRVERATRIDPAGTGSVLWDLQLRA